MPSAPMATEAGSTPKLRLLPGTSMGMSPVVRSAGGGGASCSFQSGSAGTSWAEAAREAQARASARNSRCIFDLGDGPLRIRPLALRLGIGFESGARGQLHHGRRQLRRDRLVVVVGVVGVARAHSAAQV